MSKEKKQVLNDEELSGTTDNNPENEIQKEVGEEPESEKKVKELERKVNELQDSFLRKAAEFENYKRRVENELQNMLNYSSESFIIKLLPVIDDFERSLKHISEAKDVNTIADGIRLVYDKFIKILNDQGIRKMETVGKQFDVNYHDALLQKADSTVPSHTVIEEVQPGYLYKDKVIRHAQVIVSNVSSQESSELNSGNGNNSDEGNDEE